MENSMRTSWKRVVLVLMPAAFLMQFDKHILPVLAPTIQAELELSLIDMAQILAAMTWTYAIFQMPGAWLASRLGPVRTIGLCVFGWSLAVFMTPLATGAVGIMIFRSVMGAFQAPDFVSSIMLLRREIPLRLRSRGSAVLLGGAYLGTITSGPVAVEIAAGWGWRACFQAVGAVGMMFGAAICIYSVRMKPGHHGSVGETWRSLGLGATLRVPRVHALAACYMLFLAVQSFIYTMFPLYLSAVWRTTPIATGWISSAPFIALYIAVALGGMLSDLVVRRTGSLFLARVCIGGVAMACSGTCSAIGMSVGNLATMASMMCIGMGFVGFGQVILWSAVQDLSEGAGGFVTAWVQVLGSLGTGLGPIISAYLVTAAGDWGWVRFFLVACGIGAGACLWLARPHGPTIGEEPGGRSVP